MEKLLLDTFTGLTMSDKQKMLFEDVYVEAVLVNQRKGQVSVNLVSNHIIPYREMIRLEKNIGRVLSRAGYEVCVQERFRLSEQYTPEIFWEEYQESILLMLKEENVLEFNMLYRGESRIQDGTLYLCCEDDELFRARETVLSDKIRQIFKSKAGYDLQIEVTYQAPARPEKQFATEELVLTDNAARVSANGSATVSVKAAAATGTKSSPKESSAKAGQKRDSSAKSQKEKSPAKPYQNTYQGKARRKGTSYASVDENCFYGRNCEGEIMKIADIEGETGEIVVEGMVTSTEEREIRNGEKIIFMFNLTDFTDSIQGKVFLNAEEADLFRENVSAGKFIKVKGVAVYDT